MYLKSKLIYLRYFLYRYIKKRYFRPFRLFYNIDLKCCSNEQTSFFGYYNVSPENLNKQVIYNVITKDKQNINIICNTRGVEKIIDKTSAYNMQQGCMSQWGYTTKNNIYYNIYDESNKNYKGVIYNVETFSKKELGLPIYSLSKDENYALSLNFDRLSVMRPDYGYFCKPHITLLPDEKDGIWKLDIKTNKSQLIITLDQLKHLDPVDTMKDARHKVNHIDISPDGNRFMFLHRWVGPKGRYMRLITADKYGKDIYILNGDIMTSHCFWIDNSKIISFCNTKKYGNSYTVFTDKTHNYYSLDMLPKTDGHPSIDITKKWVVTDTYPDFSRMSYLYLYNIEKKKVYRLGRFYQPLFYQATNRIDLHPKWNMAGNKVYFESGHDGYRKLYCIDLSKFLRDNE